MKRIKFKDEKKIRWQDFYQMTSYEDDIKAFWRAHLFEFFELGCKAFMHDGSNPFVNMEEMKAFLDKNANQFAYILASLHEDEGLYAFDEESGEFDAKETYDKIKDNYNSVLLAIVDAVFEMAKDTGLFSNADSEIEQRTGEIEQTPVEELRQSLENEKFSFDSDYTEYGKNDSYYQNEIQQAEDEGDSDRKEELEKEYADYREGKKKIDFLEENLNHLEKVNSRGGVGDPDDEFSFETKEAEKEIDEQEDESIDEGRIEGINSNIEKNLSEEERIQRQGYEDLTISTSIPGGVAKPFNVEDEELMPDNVASLISGMNDVNEEYKEAESESLKNEETGKLLNLFTKSVLNNAFEEGKAIDADALKGSLVALNLQTTLDNWDPFNSANSAALFEPIKNSEDFMHALNNLGNLIKAYEKAVSSPSMNSFDYVSGVVNDALSGKEIHPPVPAASVLMSENILPFTGWLLDSWNRALDDITKAAQAIKGDNADPSSTFNSLKAQYTFQKNESDRRYDQYHDAKNRVWTEKKGKAFKIDEMIRNGYLGVSKNVAKRVAALFVQRLQSALAEQDFQRLENLYARLGKDGRATLQRLQFSNEMKRDALRKFDSDIDSFDNNPKWNDVKTLFDELLVNLCTDPGYVRSVRDMYDDLGVYFDLVDLESTLRGNANTLANYYTGKNGAFSRALMADLLESDGALYQRTLENISNLRLSESEDDRKKYREALDAGFIPDKTDTVVNRYLPFGYYWGSPNTEGRILVPRNKQREGGNEASDPAASRVYTMQKGFIPSAYGEKGDKMLDFLEDAIKDLKDGSDLALTAMKSFKYYIFGNPSGRYQKENEVARALGFLENRFSDFQIKSKQAVKNALLDSVYDSSMSITMFERGKIYDIKQMLENLRYVREHEKNDPKYEEKYNSLPSDWQPLADKDNVSDKDFTEAYNHLSEMLENHPEYMSLGSYTFDPQTKSEIEGRKGYMGFDNEGNPVSVGIGDLGFQTKTISIPVLSYTTRVSDSETGNEDQKVNRVLSISLFKDQRPEYEIINNIGNPELKASVLKQGTSFTNNLIGTKIDGGNWINLGSTEKMEKNFSSNIQKQMKSVEGLKEITKNLKKGYEKNAKGVLPQLIDQSIQDNFGWTTSRVQLARDTNGWERLAHDMIQATPAQKLQMISRGVNMVTAIRYGNDTISSRLKAKIKNVNNEYLNDEELWKIYGPLFVNMQLSVAAQLTSLSNNVKSQGREILSPEQKAFKKQLESFQKLTLKDFVNRYISMNNSTQLERVVNNFEKIGIHIDLPLNNITESILFKKIDDEDLEMLRKNGLSPELGRIAAASVVGLNRHPLQNPDNIGKIWLQNPTEKENFVEANRRYLDANTYYDFNAFKKDVDETKFSDNLSKKIDEWSNKLNQLLAGSRENAIGIDGRGNKFVNTNFDRKLWLKNLDPATGEFTNKKYARDAEYWSKQINIALEAMSFWGRWLQREAEKRFVTESPQTVIMDVVTDKEGNHRIQMKALQDVYTKENAKKPFIETWKRQVKSAKNIQSDFNSLRNNYRSNISRYAGLTVNQNEIKSFSNEFNKIFEEHKDIIDPIKIAVKERESSWNELQEAEKEGDKKKIAEAKKAHEEKLAAESSLRQQAVDALTPILSKRYFSLVNDVMKKNGGDEITKAASLLNAIYKGFRKTFQLVACFMTKGGR